jgi:hypothetical protein
MDDAEREELDLRAQEIELQRTRLVFEMDVERQRTEATRTQAVAASRQAGTAIVAILVTLVISMWAQVTATSTAERTLTTQVRLANEQLRHDSEQFLQRERRSAYRELVRQARATRVALRDVQLYVAQEGRLPDGFDRADVVAHYESAQAAAADARLVGTQETSALAERVGQLCWEVRGLAVDLVEDPATAGDPAWDDTVRELGDLTRQFLALGQKQLLHGTEEVPVSG